MGCNASKADTQSNIQNRSVTSKGQQMLKKIDKSDEIIARCQFKRTLKELSKLKEDEDIEKFEIFLDGNKPEHHLFFKLAPKYKIQRCGRLILQNCDMFDADQLLKFRPKEIYSLYLHFGTVTKRSHDLFGELLPKVTNQLYLKNLNTNSEGLKQIFERTAGTEESDCCQKIIFNDCNFGGLEDSFSLNQSLNYSFCELNFFNSFKSKIDNYTTLMRALSKTNFKDYPCVLKVDKENFASQFEERTAVENWAHTADYKTLKNLFKQITSKLKTGFVVNKKLEGGIYSGGWKAGLPHGFGKIEYFKGTTYHGFFKKGKYHGYGCAHWKNGREQRYFTNMSHRHGLFREIGPFKSTDYYQLFEMSDCVKTFKNKHVKKINSGNTFWHKYFENSDSVKQLVGNQTFKEPIDYLILKSEIDWRIKEMKSNWKIQVDDEYFSPELMTVEG